MADDCPTMPRGSSVVADKPTSVSLARTDTGSCIVSPVRELSSVVEVGPRILIFRKGPHRTKCEETPVPGRLRWNQQLSEPRKSDGRASDRNVTERSFGVSLR